MIKLSKNWKTILTRAWSIKFIILAIIFQATDILLPLYSNNFDRGLFATLSILSATASFASRLVAQKGFE